MPGAKPSRDGPCITLFLAASHTLEVVTGKDVPLATRIREDQVCLSIGRENVATLRAAAAREGLPVSAIVRTWVHSLAENEAADDE